MSNAYEELMNKDWLVSRGMSEELAQDLVRRDSNMTWRNRRELVSIVSDFQRAGCLEPLFMAVKE